MLPAAADDCYRERFRKVLEYIDAHLEEELSVEQLSSVAAFSKYHFHRAFSGFLGLGVYKYVQLRRLKRASYQLAFRSASSILEIALASGYDSPESFARAFRKTIGQTPSEFRKQPQWQSWSAIYQPLAKLNTRHMKHASPAGQVKIVLVEDIQVAALEHCGDPALIGDSVRRFIEWRKQAHLLPRVSATFNLLYDDPGTTNPEDFRLDICATAGHPIAGNAFGVVAKTIEGGRCAVLRHVGSDDALGETLMYLYSQWLPQSSEELRDFPLYVQRVKFFPDVPEHEAITDVFLPLK